MPIRKATEFEILYKFLILSTKRRNKFFCFKNITIFHIFDKIMMFVLIVKITFI